MKTKRTKQISSEEGLPIRPEQLSTEQTNSQTQTPDTAPAPTPHRPALPPINFARRRANRQLPTEQVLQLLEKEAPGPFNRPK